MAPVSFLPEAIRCLKVKNAAQRPDAIITARAVSSGVISSLARIHESEAATRGSFEDKSEG